MMSRLTVTTCSILTVSIISAILALPCQSSIAATNSLNLANQEQVSSSIWVNFNNKDQSSDPKPGGDGQ
jgi:cell division protein FtsX